MIAAGSRRTFFAALAKAGLAAPTSHAEIGELFLRLLVLGVDHELVGSATWRTRILTTAYGVERRTRRCRRRSPHESEVDGDAT